MNSGLAHSLTKPKPRTLIPDYTYRKCTENILNIYFLCCRQVFRNSDFILISRHNVNNYLTLVTNFEEYSIRFAPPAHFFWTVRPLMYVGAHVRISRFSSDFASHTVRRIIVRTTTEKIEFDRGKESRWRKSIT